MARDVATSFQFAHRDHTSFESLASEAPRSAWAPPARRPTQLFLSLIKFYYATGAAESDGFAGA